MLICGGYDVVVTSSWWDIQSVSGGPVGLVEEPEMLGSVWVVEIGFVFVVVGGIVCVVGIGVVCIDVVCICVVGIGVVCIDVSGIVVVVVVIVVVVVVVVVCCDKTENKQHFAVTSKVH